VHAFSQSCANDRVPTQASLPFQNIKGQIAAIALAINGAQFRNFIGKGRFYQTSPGVLGVGFAFAVVLKKG
jgi:hypothetical protein